MRSLFWLMVSLMVANGLSLHSLIRLDRCCASITAVSTMQLWALAYWVSRGGVTANQKKARNGSQDWVFVGRLRLHFAIVGLTV
jgi:hypothetical protein